MIIKAVPLAIILLLKYVGSKVIKLFENFILFMKRFWNTDVSDILKLTNKIKYLGWYLNLTAIITVIAILSILVAIFYNFENKDTFINFLIWVIAISGFSFTLIAFHIDTK